MKAETKDPWHTKQCQGFSIYILWLVGFSGEQATGEMPGAFPTTSNTQRVSSFIKQKVPANSASTFMV